MTLSKAIEKANALRPNAVDDYLKADWIYQLESELAELMGEDMPTNVYPEDADLLMPAPKDSIYPLYLAAWIDLAQEETNLYTIDLQIANEAVADAKAWWQREKSSRSPEKVRVWL